MANTNTDLNSIFVKAVEKYHRPRKGLLSFFTTSEDNITDSLRIEFDRIRDRRLMSRARIRGAVGANNAAGTFQNVAFTPPVYKEERPFALPEFATRQAGEQFYSQESRMIKIGKKMAKDLASLSDKIMRARMWQASQIFSTGTIAFNTAGFSEGVAPVNFNCPVAHFAVLANAAGTLFWDNAASTPVANLEAHARLIRINGGSPVKNIVFGRTAWTNFRGNLSVRNELDNLRINYGIIDPQVPNMEGLGFKGTYFIDEAIVNFWTYDEVFLSPLDNTTVTEYLDPRDVLFIADGEYEEWFAGVDIIRDIQSPELQALLPSTGNVQFVNDRVAASLYVDTRKDDDAGAVFLRAQCAPLCVAKTNDTFGRLRVLN